MTELLLLTPELPYPPHQGASLRNYYIIQGLSASMRVTLLSFAHANTHDELPDAGPLADLCHEVHLVRAPARGRLLRALQLIASKRPDMAHRLASAAFAVRLRALLQERPYPLVQIEGLELAHALEIVRTTSPSTRIVFDAHNAETALQRRAFMTDLGAPRRWPLAVYSWTQVRRLARYESWTCRHADAVTAVSEADADALGALAPAVPITVIPNSLDVLAREAEASKTPEPGTQFDLLFSGKMDYRPNVDAMLWFAEAIWPRVLEARPGTTLAIVGQQPHARLDRLRAMPGIRLTGRVERVEPYLAAATVFVMPFRMGSGTRLKLIEAMAAGKPIVSTRMGAEGFPVTPGVELMLADTPNEFATAILTLLTQPQRRERLAQAARSFARRYDWRRVVPAFYEVYDGLLGSTKSE